MNEVEVTSRALLCNSPAELRDLAELVGKILGKILESPDDEKFRRVRRDSKALASKVFSKVGGRELVISLGFKRDDEHLVLEEHGVDLREAVEWLAQLAVTHVGAPEVELAIRLPGTGAVQRCSFKKAETVGDVLAYLSATHKGKRYSLVGATQRFSDEESLAGLAPRAALTATHFAEGPSVATGAMERAMEDARQKGEAQRAMEKRQRDDSERRLKAEKIERKRADVEQRARALQQYNDDRAAKQEQVERTKRTNEARRAKDAEVDAAAAEELARARASALEATLPVATLPVPSIKNDDADGRPPKQEEKDPAS